MGIRELQHGCTGTSSMSSAPAAGCTSSPAGQAHVMFAAGTLPIRHPMPEPRVAGRSPLGPGDQGEQVEDLAGGRNLIGRVPVEGRQGEVEFLGHLRGPGKVVN
jgi:hypothetical protein